MALGRRHSPFWALWAAAEILKTGWVGVPGVPSASCSRPWALFFVVLVFFVVWPLRPDWHILCITWNFTYLNDELNWKQRFAIASWLLVNSEKTDKVSFSMGPPELATPIHKWPNSLMVLGNSGSEELLCQRVNNKSSLLEKSFYRPQPVCPLLRSPEPRPVIACLLHVSNSCYRGRRVARSGSHETPLSKFPRRTWTLTSFLFVFFFQFFQIFNISLACKSSLPEFVTEGSV